MQRYFDVYEVVPAVFVSGFPGSKTTAENFIARLTSPESAAKFIEGYGSRDARALYTVREIFDPSGDNYVFPVPPTPLPPPSQVVINLSSADLLGMYPTPLPVLAAVPGKIIALVYYIMSYTYGTTPYSSPGGILDLNYTGGGSTGQIQNATFTGGASAEFIFPGIVQQLYRSQGLQLIQSAGALTGGDGTATLTIYYNLLT